MNMRKLDAIVLGMGLLMGIVAYPMFYFPQAVGISVPLFVGLALIVLFALARLAQKPSHLRNLWVIAPLLFFAVMVAIRANFFLTLVNLGAVLWFGGMLLHYRRSTHALDQANLLSQISTFVNVGLNILFAAIDPVSETLKQVQRRKLLNDKVIVAVLRGLLITLPILFLFGLLLGSADEMFGSVVLGVFTSFSFEQAQTIFLAIFFIGVIAWMACGALTYSVLRHPRDVEEKTDDITPDIPSVSPEQGLKLGMIEAGILLMGINLLFATFVVVQFTYFFGGEQNITLERGFTYAQYARRGFFELVIVSAMTLGLMLWLNVAVERPSRAIALIFRGLCIGIIAFISVMLFSASERMGLYEQVYGFTHLRIYTHVFIAWLGALYIVFLMTLFWEKRRIFTIGLTLCAIGYLATLNLMNVDFIIAEKNIERYRAGYELDVSYFYALSEDAVPVVLNFYRTETNAQLRYRVGLWLLEKENNVVGLNPWFFAVNLSRNQAYDLLKDWELAGE